MDDVIKDGGWKIEKTFESHETEYSKYVALLE